MIVLDSSAVVYVLVDRAEAESVRRRMAGLRAIAPHLLDVEVMSVLRRMHRLAEIDEAMSVAAMAALSRLRVERWAHRPLLDGIWQVHDNISAYDAAYVSLATNLGATLLTCDARLAKAAKHWCDVDLLADAD